MPTGFTTNAHRYDPHKNFKFPVLKGDGITFLRVSKLGGLKRTTEVVSHRSGGENSFEYKSPGRSSYEALSMERGITHDTEFERWASMVHSYDGDPTMDLVNYKQDLSLEVLNERGQIALRYFLFDCWVSEFTASPDLDAGAIAVAVVSLALRVGGGPCELGGHPSSLPHGVPNTRRTDETQ